MTNRGRPVALLVPAHEDRWQDLVASGQVVAAATEGDLVDEAPGHYGIDASARLAATRDRPRHARILGRPTHALTSPDRCRTGTTERRSSNPLPGPRDGTFCVIGGWKAVTGGAALPFLRWLICQRFAEAARLL